MRLTKRTIICPMSDNNGNLIKVECIEVKDKGLAEEKLCQLEDIEDELGIDLITLYKLFKASHIYAYSHTSITKCNNDGVNLYDKTIAIYNGVCVVEYPLSEYGKSFALTKEELLW